MIRNFLFAAACCVPAFAVTPITQCGQTLSTAGETYVLTANLTCPAVVPPADPTGVRVVANNVVIDLQGFTLTGAGAFTGILTATLNGCVAVKGLEVKNGTIENFGTAISLCAPGQGGPFPMNANIHNLAIRNSQVGIVIAGSSGNAVRNNKISAINVPQSPANPFTAFRTGTAISVEKGLNNKIENNQISGAAANGIALIFGSADNEVQRNTIAGSGTNGIAVFGAGVAYGGAAYAASDNNLVRNNRVSASTAYDMFDGNAACGANDWIKNTFLTAGQGCIH